MTDEELVKRLRKGWHLGIAAADRIEALTEQLESARADAKEAEAYAEELCGQISELNDKVAEWSVRAEAAEAKLAECLERNALLEARLGKAVELLRRHCDQMDMSDADVATLVEIVGDTT